MQLEYFDFSFEQLIEFAKSKEEEYASNPPFPNIYFENFFKPEAIDKVLDEFPDLSKDPDIKFVNPYEIKLASKGEYRFGLYTRHFVHFLNSQPFLEFLSELTGIPNLICDPYFEGGGYHQIMPGGLLKIHADFNKHMRTKLDRRLNVLIYLNKDWDKAWGGHFELWDREMKKCVRKVPPHFNTMAIFSTTDFSYHGHPDPLRCPEGRSRKSIALYYYTNGRPLEEIDQGLEHHGTLFVDRKDSVEDKKMKRFMTVVRFVEQITPPFILTIAKKLVSKKR